MGLRGGGSAEEEATCATQLDREWQSLLDLQQHAARLQRLYATFRTRLAQPQQRPRSGGARRPSGPGAAPRAPPPLSPEASQQRARAVARALGTPRDTLHFTLGAALFGLLLLLAGAAPGALPWAFVACACVCLPWRAASFCRRKYGFYLIDFCYFANLAALAHLLLLPASAELGAMVYALCDGPLAGALLVWQSAWVMGSAYHTISVFVHLLPGLAVFAHRHFPGVHGWRAALGFSLHHLGLRPAAGGDEQVRPGAGACACLGPAARRAAGLPGRPLPYAPLA
jgi:hypothetical protein